MPRFTPGELKVMRLLWEHGELKPAELQGRFPEPIKNPALRSYLTTLVEKGHVTRRRVGKAYYYKAGDPVAVGVPDDARRAGRRLLRRLGAGAGDEHHQVGEAQRGRAARAQAAGRRGPRAAARRRRGADNESRLDRVGRCSRGWRRRPSGSSWSPGGRCCWPWPGWHTGRWRAATRGGGSPSGGRSIAGVGLVAALGVRAAGRPIGPSPPAAVARSPATARRDDAGPGRRRRRGSRRHRRTGPEVVARAPAGRPGSPRCRRRWRPGRAARPIRAVVRRPWEFGTWLVLGLGDRRRRSWRPG